MTSSFKAIKAYVLMVVAIVSLVASVSSLWNYAVPILTYDIPPGGLGFEWGTGPQTLHYVIQMKNLGWSQATNYEAEIDVAGNITNCVVERTSLEDLVACRDVFPPIFQPCNAQDMLIAWGNNSAYITSLTFPAGCDLILLIDSIGPYPLYGISGKSDQGQILAPIAANQLIAQRDTLLWVGIILLIVALPVALWSARSVVKSRHYATKGASGKFSNFVD